MNKYLRQYILWPTACVSMMAAGGGCISASLATSTGPCKPGDTWSVAGRQRAHVGEEVAFDVILQKALGGDRALSPVGIADYCVALIGDERLEAEPDWRGHFTFSHRFTDVRPGDKVEVKATLYRQKGRRDHMRIAGQWVRSSSPYEEADRHVAGDSVRLEFYEAPIEIMIDPSADEWLVGAARLDIRRSDGSIATVLADRPDRPGFTFSGPDAAGRVKVNYVPSGAQLNPSGTTEVIFTIGDRAGRTVRKEQTLPTP